MKVSDLSDGEESIEFKKGNHPKLKRGPSGPSPRERILIGHSHDKGLE